MIKKYKITWSKRQVVIQTIDKIIEAKDSDIVQMAKLGKFKYIEI